MTRAKRDSFGSSGAGRMLVDPDINHSLNLVACGALYGDGVSSNGQGKFSVVTVDPVPHGRDNCLEHVNRRKFDQECAECRAGALAVGGRRLPLELDVVYVEGQ